MTTAIAYRCAANSNKNEENNQALTILAIDRTITNYKHCSSVVDKYLLRGNFAFLFAGPMYVRSLWENYLDRQVDDHVDVFQGFKMYQQEWIKFLGSAEFLRAKGDSDPGIQVIVANSKDIMVLDNSGASFEINAVSVYNNKIPTKYVAVGTGADFADGAFQMNYLTKTPKQGVILLTSLLEVSSRLDPGTGSVSAPDESKFYIIKATGNVEKPWEVYNA